MRDWQERAAAVVRRLPKRREPPSAAAIVLTGDLYRKAKEIVPRGEWTAWAEWAFNMPIREVQRLMQIARDPNICRYMEEFYETGRHPLPAETGVLAALCGLTAECFDLAVGERVINPSLRRRHLNGLAGLEYEDGRARAFEDAA